MVPQTRLCYRRRVIDCDDRPSPPHPPDRRGFAMVAAFLIATWYAAHAIFLKEKPVKRILGLFIVLAVAPVAQAADVEAGKAKVATVCAACHGANGVSVSDAIPNLAAQRAGYVEAQLKALKEGARKNQIMNAIATQLSAEDMANVAAYFASQPGAARQSTPRRW